MKEQRDIVNLNWIFGGKSNRDKVNLNWSVGRKSKETYIVNLSWNLGGKSKETHRTLAEEAEDINLSIYHKYI